MPSRELDPATRIGPNTLLPAVRGSVTLSTSDGLRLVGELAVPAHRPASATLVCLHPLPTHGGSMDSHLLRKLAARIPALAGMAVLRFNTRGTTSATGRSDGTFDGGVGERHDLAAALELVQERGLPAVWLVGWSFGADLALMHGCRPPVRGAVLLAPPLRRCRPEHLAEWIAAATPVTCLVPEHDDYLRPERAAARLAAVPNARVRPIAGARHLFVGHTETVLDGVVSAVAGAQGLPIDTPLPRHWPVHPG